MITSSSAINRLTLLSMILLGLLISFLLLDSTVGLETCSSKRPTDFILRAPFVSGFAGPLLNCTSIESCNKSRGSCLVQNTVMNLQAAGNSSPAMLLEKIVENVINLTKRNLNKNIRIGIMREYTHVCHEVLNKSLHDCFAKFIDVCLNLPSHKSPSPCINLLYNHCLNGTEDCREAVENEIEEIIEKECDEDYDDCEELIDDIFNNNLKFNSMKRLGSAVRVSSLKMKNATRLFTKRRKVIRELVGNINDVSNIIDQEDLQILYEVMDLSFNVSHVSSLSLSLSEEIGPMLLTNLKEMNIVFGKAILSGGGRIKNDYNFYGNNLGVSFKITDSEDNFFEHSSDEGLSVEINLPRTALCQSIGVKINESNNEDEEYEEDEDDVPDRYNNCFPPQFPSNCRYVIMSSITQNIDTLFEKISKRTLLSIILSIQVVSNDTTDVNGMFDLSENIKITFNVSKINYTMIPVCHYWNQSLKDWSTDGMTTTILSSSQVLCTSNHLTSFALLADDSSVITNGPSTKPTEISLEELLSLQVVGYIGCSISIISLLFAIVLLVLLRKQLQKGPLLYVHINLSLALLLGLLMFVFGIDLPRSIPWLCSVVAGLLHYLFLCVFCWSLAEGIMLYILIVRVYGSLADRWYLLLPLGWGLPIIIVGISAGIRHDLYGIDDQYCWLSTSKGMIWSFIGPMILIIIINIILLTMTIYQITHSKSLRDDPNVKRIDIVKSGLKGILVLLPLLSITWIIGIFAFNKQTTVFLWLFTILNSLQGLTILYMHVLRNKFISDWVKKKLSHCLRRTKKEKSLSNNPTNETLMKKSSTDSKA